MPKNKRVVEKEDLMSLDEYKNESERILYLSPKGKKLDQTSAEEDEDLNPYATNTSSTSY